ncbi:hypothetical protein ACGFJ7_21765 [Actinoplanes sp. NPDC048988]|uniref:hypothetical protein n=1 Tax=Actinoplanes sp. NPDC048988 TaxID=3363901 RepID=UPI00372398CA
MPASLWDSIAGSEAALRKQRDLYRLNVDSHIRQIHRLDRRARREYLETNAEAILFDAHALLSSVKAWTGHQALHAGRARAAGAEDAAEALLVEAIARDTGEELKSALAETTRVVDALTRELRIVAELPGRDTLALPGMRKDSNATRQTSARLLEALEPLADALHPPIPPLDVPEIVCASRALDHGKSLRILRWFLEDGETVRVLGFPDQLDGAGSISSIVSGAKGMLGGAKDKMADRDLVAVTDRRVITAKATAFLEQGELRQDIPLDQVRYVRSTAPAGKDGRFTIDLITRDDNIRWLFPRDVESSDVDALAAVLAESMTIPEGERAELLRRRPALVEADTN